MRTCFSKKLNIVRHSQNFIHYAGNWAVPVRYDLTVVDFYELLGSMKGIFFAGGATPLVDMETGEQP